MTVASGTGVSERMAKIEAQFCCVSCRFNLNGCAYCGRAAGPILGLREAGVIKTLSGGTSPVYREITFMQGRSITWTIYFSAGPRTGRPVTGPAAIRSFRPA